MNKTFRALLIVPSLALVVAARADLEAFQGLYVGNYDSNGNESFAGIDGNGTANDASSPFTVTDQTFTGLDRSGQTQTLHIEGSAYSSSSYGKVHMFGQGTVTNAYFNPDNTPAVAPDGTYNPAGSPDLVGIHGNAGWTDSITYTGFQGTGYKVNYYFRLEGNVSGDTEAGLNFSAGGQYYSPRTTQGNEMWITPDFDVNWGVPTDISIDMYAGLTTHLSNYADGATVSGSADYSNTLILEGVRITDPSGNVVTGYDVSSNNGGNYIHAVPEPSTLAAAAIGGLAFLRRRKRA